MYNGKEHVMYAVKQIGCYNVSINDGQLDHETNRWYYIMSIDKFDIGDDWRETHPNLKDTFNIK